jgi:hypothetical protein
MDIFVRSAHATRCKFEERIVHPSATKNKKQKTKNGAAGSPFLVVFLAKQKSDLQSSTTAMIHSRITICGVSLRREGELTLVALYIGVESELLTRVLGTLRE